MRGVWPAPGAAKGDRVSRVRFLAPDLKKGADTDADLKTLCEKVARPMVKAKGATVDQVIVSLASKPLKLGESRVIEQSAAEWAGEGGRRRWLGKERRAVSKGGKEEQFHE